MISLRDESLHDEQTEDKYSPPNSGHSTIFLFFGGPADRDRALGLDWDFSRLSISMVNGQENA